MINAYLSMSEGYKTVSPLINTIPAANAVDGNRLQMAKAFLLQSMICKKAEPPLVTTLHTSTLAHNSTYFIRRAVISGTFKKLSNSLGLIIKNEHEIQKIEIFPILFKFTVEDGEHVKQGEIVAKHVCYTSSNEIKYGVHLSTVTSFLKGLTFEDAIVISESAAEKLTSYTIGKMEFELEFPTFIFNPEIIETSSFKQNDWFIKQYSRPKDIYSSPVKVDVMTDKVDNAKIVNIEIELFTKTKSRRKPKLPDETIEIINRFGLDTTLERYVNKVEEKYRKKTKSLLRKTFKNPNNRELYGLVKVYYIAEEKFRKGDKLANRFGNKGVVSKIVDDKWLKKQFEGKIPEDFQPELVLSPPGIFARNNPAQLMEMKLNLLCRDYIPPIVKKMKSEGKSGREIVRWLKTEIYDTINSETSMKLGRAIQKLKDDQLELVVNDIIERGFVLKLDSFEENLALKTDKLLNKFNVPYTKVGYGVSYIMKLEHMVNKKIKAISTGQYIQKTQQPLDGQKIGEMEIWTLCSYGAVNSLYGVKLKADDLKGKEEAYAQIVEKGFANIDEITDNVPRTTEYVLAILKMFDL